MVREQVVIDNKLGLHARAAAKFVTVASQFTSDILVRSGDKEVNGKSIMGLMMLAANTRTLLQIEACGDDEEQALSELVALISNRFHEEA